MSCKLLSSHTDKLSHADSFLLIPTTCQKMDQALTCFFSTHVNYSCLFLFRGKAMECSAKEGRNVREIFKTFLQLSQIRLPNVEESGGFFGGGGLRRRSSAYAGTKSRQNPQPSTPTSTNSPRVGGLGMLRGTVSTPSSSALNENGDGEGSSFSRNKPRSRSLIRRSSKKAKQQVRDASGGAGAGDCRIA